MDKFKRASGKVHPSDDPKKTKPKQAANKGTPTSNKSVKPMGRKGGRYTGTT